MAKTIRTTSIIILVVLGLINIYVLESMLLRSMLTALMIIIGLGSQSYYKKSISKEGKDQNLSSNGN